MMQTEHSIHTDTLHAILADARLAPSVHNTQPWRVSLQAAGLQVDLDPAHVLNDGDPTGRQTMISLGIFCEAIVLAAANHGLAAKTVSLHGQSALIALSESVVDEAAAESLELLRRRVSDRSIFKSVSLTPEHIAAVEGVPAASGVAVRLITDPQQLQQIAQLTGQGIGLALSSPSFRNELSRYLVLPWSRKTRGIAVKSLYIAWPIAILEPLLLRLGMNLGAEARLERRRWESASAVVAILADGDLSKYWLEAGRTYLRVSLAIESQGLSQATSASVVEASNYHEDIEAALGTNQRILAVIRVGKGSAKRHYSPRVGADELLTSN